MTAANIVRALRSQGRPAVAVVVQRYFRAEPGGHGAGDRFLGIRLPILRRMARRHARLPLSTALALLRSPWHEARLLALLLLIERHRRGGPKDRERVHRVYLAHTRFVNNWDLIDVSAPCLVGAHTTPAGDKRLDRLAGSRSLWERRIAIVATLHWIRLGEFRPTLRIARRLRRDPHDLIHKATGWMLREVARRDRAAAEAFLLAHGRALPREMLRRVIEDFPIRLRRRYLSGAAFPADRPARRS